MSSKTDFTELYIGTKLLHRAQSSHRFLKDDLINIAKSTYIVTQVSFALDYINDAWSTEVVQTVRITKVK